jgi:hypothetical protein
MAREDDLVATERALGRVRMECDTKCNRAEAVGRPIRPRCACLPLITGVP